MPNNTPAEKKDAWDKLSILGAALIPAAIALAGFFYSNASKQAEDTANELKAKREGEIATINAQVNQAHLLGTFMEPLLSGDTLKQAIAMNAILIGVPVQGKQIVEMIAGAKAKGSIQQLASTALTGRRTELTRLLFSDDKATRLNAAAELSNAWLKDKSTVQEIISNINAAFNNPSIYPNVRDGIINCFVVLQNADPNLLSTFKNELYAVVQRVPTDSTNTRNAGKQVLLKIK
jgi:hypothetical protein